ncbi:MAG: putative Ig domain-containing protein, partial [Blastocatellia bacterium]
GGFPITVTATDSNGCTGSRNYTLVINCPTITVNPTTIATGTAGAAYSTVTFTQAGGVGSVTFSESGALPAGLIFSAGVLSGTPLQTGSFPLTVMATDSNGCTGFRNYTLVIGCPVITVGPSVIPAGTAGSAYPSTTFTQTGGVGSVTFSETGTLPTGMIFSAGVLSGTPTQTGSFPITITATDQNGCTGSQGYTLTINCQEITVGPDSVPSGTQGVAYTSTTFTQSGGIGTIVFWETGTLPSGLTLTAAGVLSGTPSQTGAFPITVTATDSNGCTGGASYVIAITCPSVTITVSPGFLPSGTSGTAYPSTTFTATGGTAGYTFTEAGTLPAGLTFSAGVLSGTPTQSGIFPITVAATDSHGCAGVTNYIVAIACSGVTIAVSPPTLSAGTAGSAYPSTTFSAGGGASGYTFKLGGSLPAGLTFSAGVLSGTPTQAGSFQFTVAAMDTNGCAGSTSYTLVIACPAISVGPVSIPSGTAGTAYTSTQFTETGGVGAATFSETGALPMGLTLSSDGLLSGRPLKTGSFPITVVATDSNGCTGSKGYTLVIACPTIAVGPGTIPTGTGGAAYASTQFTQTGAVGAVTFSESGTLPAGVSLSSTGVLSGTPVKTGSFPITVTATDSNGCTGSQGYTLVINCPVIRVSPSVIPAAVQNEPYSVQFGESGGIGAVAFSTTSALPAGLTLSSAGLLSGTPTTGGSFSITVTATDANGCTGNTTTTLSVTALDKCLKDNTNGYFVQFNSTSGDYLFTVCGPNGFTLSGRGTLSVVNSIISITDAKA